MRGFDIFRNMKNPDAILLLLALQKDGTTAAQIIVEKNMDGDYDQIAHSVVVKTTDADGLFDSVTDVIGKLHPGQLNVAVVAGNGVLAIVADFANGAAPWVGDMTHEQLAERIAFIEDGAIDAGQEFENFLEMIEDLEDAPTNLMQMAAMKMHHNLDDLEEIIN